nr:MAG TPA: putative sporulation protein [Caudoviricetes sp.]
MVRFYKPKKLKITEISITINLIFFSLSIKFEVRE